MQLIQAVQDLEQARQLVNILLDHLSSIEYKLTTVSVSVTDVYDNAHTLLPMIDDIDTAIKNSDEYKKEYKEHYY